MSILNEGEFPSGEPWEVQKCDRCGKIIDTRTIEGDNEYDKAFSIKRFWWREIFFKRPKDDAICADYCYECAKEVTGIVYELRDVDELRLYVNKLRRAIDERKKAD